MVDSAVEARRERGARTKWLLFGIAGVLAAASPNLASAQDGESLSNRSIIRMVKAQLGEALIIGKIEISKANFDLSTDALIELKEEGVSDKVIKAMQASGAEAPGAARKADAAPPSRSSASEVGEKAREPDVPVRARLGDAESGGSDGKRKRPDGPVRARLEGAESGDLESKFRTAYRTEFQIGRAFSGSSSRTGSSSLSAPLVGGTVMAYPSPYFGLGLGLHKFDIAVTQYDFVSFEGRVLSYMLLGEVGSSVARRYGAGLRLGVGGYDVDGAFTFYYPGIDFPERHEVYHGNGAMALAGVQAWIAPVKRIIVSVQFNDRFLMESSDTLFRRTNVTEIVLGVGAKFGG